jgi:hypothetical protein
VPAPARSGPAACPNSTAAPAAKLEQGVANSVRTERLSPEAVEFVQARAIVHAMIGGRATVERDASGTILARLKLDGRPLLGAARPPCPPRARRTTPTYSRTHSRRIAGSTRRCRRQSRINPQARFSRRPGASRKRRSQISSVS